MSPSAIALAIIFGIILFASALGVYAGSRYRMDLEQWTVAGRGFGLLLVWLLMAGEIYTTFTFLGASGWAYSRGGPILYVLSYGTLGFVISFFILPPIWKLAKRHKLQTQPDFFRAQYGSQGLAAFVSVVGVAASIIYLEIQIIGLGIIMRVASFEGIGRQAAMIVGVVLVAGFVYAGGVRAVAWVSVLKDGLMLSAAIFIGFAIPRIYFGGVGPMFAELARAKPQHLVMPGATANLNHGWFISTVLLSAMGFYMWPHAFASTFSARSSDTLRRNAVYMPFYQLTMALMLFVGFTAILIIPGLSDGDLSLLTLVRRTFPPWFLGLVGGAGALTAMVPAAIIVLSCSASLAKNVYRPVIAPAMTDSDVARLARLTALALSAISVVLALYSSTTVVSLLLLGYAGVTQFFPGVTLGLYWKGATAPGIFSGMVLGVLCTIFLVLTKRDPFLGLNAGFVALCANFLTATVISLITGASRGSARGGGPSHICYSEKGWPRETGLES